MTKPCALYRHFDADGELLYVGIAANPFKRTGEHRTHADWFASVVRIDIEWFDSRAEAKAAETQAIGKGQPENNRSEKRFSPDELQSALHEREGAHVYDAELCGFVPIRGEDGQIVRDTRKSAFSKSI